MDFVLHEGRDSWNYDVFDVYIEVFIKIDCWEKKTWIRWRCHVQDICVWSLYLPVKKTTAGSIQQQQSHEMSEWKILWWEEYGKCRQDISSWHMQKMLQNNQRQLRGNWWAHVKTWGCRHLGRAFCCRINHVIISAQDTALVIFVLALKSDVSCYPNQRRITNQTRDLFDIDKVASTLWNNLHSKTSMHFQQLLLKKRKHWLYCTSEIVY